MKLLVHPFPCKKLDMSIKTFWLFHTVPQQSHSDLSFCSVHYVNQIMSQFEMFIHVFGLCRSQRCGQKFLSSNVFCCNDQQIPQTNKLVEICFSLCMILDQSENFVVIFLENVEFYIQVIGIIFGPEKPSNSVLAFAKVHIVATS